MFATDRGIATSSTSCSARRSPTSTSPTPSTQRAVGRYEHVGAWLADYWAASPCGWLVYPQGSFRLGTVVQPINSRRRVRHRPRVPPGHRQAVDDAGGIEARRGAGAQPVRGERAGWHADDERGQALLDLGVSRASRSTSTCSPRSPMPTALPNAILLTDKDLRTWQHSNPIDYASWFHAPNARRSSSS